MKMVGEETTGQAWSGSWRLATGAGLERGVLGLGAASSVVCEQLQQHGSCTQMGRAAGNSWHTYSAGAAGRLQLVKSKNNHFSAPWAEMT